MIGCATFRAVSKRLGASASPQLPPGEAPERAAGGGAGAGEVRAAPALAPRTSFCKVGEPTPITIATGKNSTCADLSEAHARLTARFPDESFRLEILGVGSKRVLAGLLAALIAVGIALVARSICQ